MADRSSSRGHPIPEPARREALGLARRAVAAHFGRDSLPTPPGEHHPLWRPRAAFVTWRRRSDGALRGCRGEVQAVRPLYLAIARQAVAAAVDDPRFPPVTPDELDAMAVHISALTELAPIDPADVELGRHGLLIRRGGRAGLLLPQVPSLYDIPTREAFLQAVCRKAGLPPDAWGGPEAELLAFEAEDWGDEDEPG
jgi:AmmeMemoRadiSam system protein A